MDASFSDQSSNTNIFRNATDDPAQPVFPSVSINGNIGTGTDVDFYSFFGTVGAQTFFDIDTDAFPSTFRLGDSVLSLFDPAGTSVAFSDDSPNDLGSANSGGDSFLGIYTLPTNGFYRIAVSGNPNFSTSLGSLSGGVSPLTRPDGNNGGFALTGATLGDSSFNFTGTPGRTGNYTLHISSGAAVVVPSPEPATWAMMIIGLAMRGAVELKRKKSAARATGA